MTRPKVSPTDDLRNAIQRYADAHELSWSAAAMELAAIGLAADTGEQITDAAKKWGGNRYHYYAECKARFTPQWITSDANKCVNCGESHEWNE